MYGPVWFSSCNIFVPHKQLIILFWLSQLISFYLGPRLLFMSYTVRFGARGKCKSNGNMSMKSLSAQSLRSVDGWTESSSWKASPCRLRMPMSSTMFDQRGSRVEGHMDLDTKRTFIAFDGRPRENRESVAASTSR